MSQPGFPTLEIEPRPFAPAIFLEWQLNADPSRYFTQFYTLTGSPHRCDRAVLPLEVGTPRLHPEWR